MASSTHAISMRELQPPISSLDHDESTKTNSSAIVEIPKSTELSEQSVMDERPDPSTTAVELQRWNNPRGNIGRLAAAFSGFFIAGTNDAAIGALIPYLETYYSLSYTVISLIFLTPFAGYTLAAFTNATYHSRFGQRGVVITAATCHIVNFLVVALHPPFPVIVVAAMIGGFGNGLLDAAMSAWTGHMVNGNTLEGLLHSFYSAGATFAPLIATSMVARARLPWYTFYYLMTGMAVCELVGCSLSFFHKTGPVYRMEHPRDVAAKESRTKEALRNKVTWLCSFFFLTYLGAEVSLGGWIVSFMLNVRKASPYSAGVSATGFWAGMTLGRAGLGPLTEHFGERLCVSIYLACALALELIFWLVPHFVVSAVAVAFLGLCIGPVFPSGIIMATKLLPKQLHVSSVGFSTAIDGTGAAIFPFVVGAIAQHRGVGVLQPIICALLAVLFIIWMLFPKIKKQNVE